MPPTYEQRTHVEKNWPELAALADMLEHLTAQPFGVQVAAAGGNLPAVAEAVIRHINEKAQAGPVFVSGAVKS